MGCAQHLKTFPARFVNQTKASSPMFHWSYTLKVSHWGDTPCAMPQVQKRVLFKRISLGSQYHPHWLGTIKEGKKWSRTWQPKSLQKENQAKVHQQN